jgi:hypothetical protein
MMQLNALPDGTHQGPQCGYVAPLFLWSDLWGGGWVECVFGDRPILSLSPRALWLPTLNPELASKCVMMKWGKKSAQQASAQAPLVPNSAEHLEQRECDRIVEQARADAKQIIAHGAGNPQGCFQVAQLASLTRVSRGTCAAFGYCSLGQTYHHPPPLTHPARLPVLPDPDAGHAGLLRETQPDLGSHGVATLRVADARLRARGLRQSGRDLEVEGWGCGVRRPAHTGGDDAAAGLVTGPPGRISEEAGGSESAGRCVLAGPSLARPCLE